MRLPQQHWSRFRHVDEQAQHLDEVMARLSIDPLTAARLDAGRAFAQARRNCLECKFERQCRYWIDGSIAMEGPPTFCPNAAFFAACKQAQDASPRQSAQPQVWAR